jgi:hypothetical protein
MFVGERVVDENACIAIINWKRERETARFTLSTRTTHTVTPLNSRHSVNRTFLLAIMIFWRLKKTHNVAKTSIQLSDAKCLL